MNTINLNIQTWNEEDQYEVYMVGQPADYEEDDHNEAHLDNLPLLLHSSGNGWLPDGVLTHAEQVVPATPQLSPSDSVAVSCGWMVGQPDNNAT